MLKHISALSAAAFAATMTGLIREATVAYVFGTSGYADAVATAIFLHDTVAAAFITGGFSYAALPVIARERLGRGDTEAVRLVMATSAWVAIASMLLAVIAFLAIPSAVRVAMHEETRQRATVMIAILRGALPALVLMAVGSSIAAFLPAFNRFVHASLGRVLWNAGVVIGLLFAFRLGSLTAIVLALLAGALANLLTAAFSLPVKTHSGLVSFRHAGLGHLARVATPSLISVAGINLALGMWERYLLAGVGVGSIAVVNYAQRASYMASTISAAVHVVAFTEMTKDAADGGLTPRGIESIRSVARRYLLFLVPTMCFMILARRDIVALLFARGAFDQTSLIRTAAAFGTYSLSIVPVFVVGLFIRMLFALQRPWVALVLLGVTALVSAIADRALVPALAELAIPAGYSLGMAVGAASAVWFVDRKVGASLIRSMLSATAWALVLGAAGVLVSQVIVKALPFWNSCGAAAIPSAWCLGTRLATAFIVFMLSATFFGYLLGIDDVRQGAQWLRARMVAYVKS